MDAGDRRFLAALATTPKPQTANGSGEPGDVYALIIPHDWALVHLAPTEGRPMAELARLLRCDNSNGAKIVDRLERLKWARRVPGKEGDRRFMRVELDTQAVERG